MNIIKPLSRTQALNIDNALAYGSAIDQLKEGGECLSDMVHRQVKYLNNRIESDHGNLNG